MSLPSHTFSDARAAQMQVVFSAAFSSTAAGGEWWSGDAAWNIVVECTVSAGATVLGTTYIDFKNPSASIVIAYAGAGAVLTLTMAHASHSFGGIGSVECLNPTIAVFLMP